MLPAVEEVVARVAREAAMLGASTEPQQIYNTNDEQQMAALQEWRREMEASG